MTTLSKGAAPEHVTSLGPGRWHAVCRLSDLSPERGSAALVGGVQIALIRLRHGAVRAVQQLDPYSGANIMSRGIVGTRGGVDTVAAPMYKQVFDLATGGCLDAVGYSPRSGLAPDLETWPVEVVDGVVHVLVEPATSEAAVA